MGWRKESELVNCLAILLGTDVGRIVVLSYVYVGYEVLMSVLRILECNM